jgi:hypothetical protein
VGDRLLCKESSVLEDATALYSEVLAVHHKATVRAVNGGLDELQKPYMQVNMDEDIPGRGRMSRGGEESEK